MRTIFGTSTGLRFIHHHRRDLSLRAPHPWPLATAYSLGGTAGRFFLEAYPPGVHVMVRGDGETLEAAEGAAWASWQRNLHCLGDGEHDWHPGKYTNGVGACSRCRAMRSRVFTGEDLGQFCRACGDGTTYFQTEGGDWFCDIHVDDDDRCAGLPSWLLELDDEDPETFIDLPAGRLRPGGIDSLVRLEMRAQTLASDLPPWRQRLRIDASRIAAPDALLASELAFAIEKHRPLSVKIIGGRDAFRRQLRDVLRERGQVQLRTVVFFHDPEPMIGADVWMRE